MKHWNQTETHQKISDDHERHEEGETQGLPRHFHAVPQSFNPLSTEAPDDEAQSVEKILHVPAGKLAVC